MVWNPSSPDQLVMTPQASCAPLTPTTPGTPNTRLTERQQVTLIKQMTASSPLSKLPSTPQSAKKQTSETYRGCKSVTKRNERGETRLHLAVIRGDVHQTRWLIKHGADVNAADFAGWTPLHEACNHGWNNIAKILLKAGADPDASGFDGFTPLHDASVNGHVKLVELLLKNNATPSLSNCKGLTPLDVAASLEISLLLKRDSPLPGEDFHIKDSFTAFPLDQEFVAGKETNYVSKYLELTSGKSAGRCHQDWARVNSTANKIMRKNSPQHQAPKAAPDKPSSPRLTLRFQPIKPKDDRHGEGSKSTSVSSSEPRYQSYCVTMETREDVYEFKKGDTPVSSTRSSSSSPNSDGGDSQLNVVSSSKDVDSISERGVDNYRSCSGAGSSTTPSSKNKSENHMHGQQQQLSSQVEKLKFEYCSENEVKNNGNKMTGDGINHIRPEYDEMSDGEPDDGRRKRRRESKDSTDSKHSGSSGSNLRNHGREKCVAAGSNGGPRGEEKKNSLGDLPVPTKVASGSDTESTQSDLDNEGDKHCEVSNMSVLNNSCHQLSPKVPPLKIVIPTTSILEPDRDRCRSTTAKQALPYIVSTSTDSSDGKSESSVTHDGGMSCDKENSKDEHGKDLSYHPEEKYQRVTRSSQRMAAALASAGASTLHGQNMAVENSNYHPDSHKAHSGDGSSEEQISVDVHPRKRKLRAREGGPPSDCSGTPSTSHQDDQPVMNCYEMYLSIKKQVDRRRRNMFVVQPKAPQGFKDYLMNRCSYVLAGNAASRLSVPMIPPPQSLVGSMRELFIGQEKERYQLRLQHIIEKEKLMLGVEQEILRVHGRAARAIANQSIPLSVCTVLKDEEIYNHIEPEQLEKVTTNVNISHHYLPLEEKERNARSRYNGRVFLSWLQDVDNKWEKIKKAMLLRHHNEAESLQAVQKLDWGWKMKETGSCDPKSTPVIDDIHVPMVHVNDEFDLLPA